MERRHDIITILGPTASGKTSVAVHLAQMVDGIILSGDSRQVYRGMDIGTGKDLSEYRQGEHQIEYRLIDICEPGEKYNVYRYKQDFFDAYDEIPTHQQPILCGGSGLYIEAILGGYHLPNVPADPTLRTELDRKDILQLQALLESYETPHNTTDTSNKKRLIRAIEIAKYRAEHPIDLDSEHRPKLEGPIFVLDVDREVRRDHITRRLKERIEHGLLEEVQGLLDQGVSPEDLIYYGLEYKYVTQHLLGEFDAEEMFRRLEIVIHQYAKRQMTWIRGMSKRGLKLTYIKPEVTPHKTALRLFSMLDQQ